MKFNDNYDYYSFDVFDTLITRLVLKPVDLFYELGCYLESKKLISDARLFQIDRIEAEKIARKESIYEDINLSEIYSKMFNYSDVELLIKYEIQFELKYSSPIKKNVDLLNYILEKKKNIIIVSDMYLSKSILFNILKKNNISINCENIFVSSDFRLTKRSGNLFKKICQIRKIDSNKILHIGNDWKADCMGAKKAGIDYYHYKEWQNNKCEKETSDNISVLGVSRALRLKNDDPLKEISYNFISPLLYDFVDFIIKKSISLGYKEIFFLSRDGQILYKIAKEIINKREINIDVKYIYASRKLLSYPSIFNFDLEDLKWVLVDSDFTYVSDIIERLELDKFSKIIYDFFGLNRRLSLDDLNSFIIKFKYTDLGDYILQKSNFYRNNLISYLNSKTNNILEIVIVDIGWRLNIQKYFKKILENYFMRDISISGFYLGVNSGHVSINDVGNVYAYISHSKAKVRSEYINDFFFKKPSIMILEHIFCCADHPPLKNYPTSNYLSFYPELDEDLKFDIQKIHEGVLEYTFYRNYLSLSLSGGDVALNNALKFIYYPNKNQVRSLDKFNLNKDILHNVKYSKSIIYPIKNIGDIGKTEWIYGSIALSSFLVRFFIYPFVFFKRPFL